MLRVHRNRTLFIFTPVIILVSHYLAVFLHEYAHSFSAWILGYKNSPFDLNYGGWSIWNVLLLLDIDQNVNTARIVALGHPKHVAYIAFSGPGINILLYFLSYWLLKNKSLSRPILAYFLFFFCLMNLGNIYDYVPIRTFVTQGIMVDILDIEQGLQISPWVIYFFGGYLVAYLIWQFFSHALILTYQRLNISNKIGQAGLMITSVLILFGYYSLPGFFSYGEIPYFVSMTAILAIPGILILLWPSRQ